MTPHLYQDNQMSEVVSDEKVAIAPKSPLMKLIITTIAVTMSLYHMYVAGFGPPEDEPTRTSSFSPP